METKTALTIEQIADELRARIHHCHCVLELDGLSKRMKTIHRQAIFEDRDMLEWILDDNREMNPEWRVRAI